MRALVLGAGGQLGRALIAACGSGDECTAMSRAECDIANESAVESALSAERPDVVFIAAAYTNVDGAESDPQSAREVNELGARTVARVAQARGAHVVYFSTDYVFDGAQSHPYAVTDAPNPLNVYGATKLAGERAVGDATEGRALVLRTAWLYSPHGRNFMLTVLEKIKGGVKLRVIDDQIGTPTSARSVAKAAWRAARERLAGTHHWTDAGVATWYDFACAIAASAGSADASSHEITPITSREYASPARRPSYSVLDKHETWSVLGTRAEHWRDELERVMTVMRDG